jgi:Zinc carboxypeptidase
MPPAPPDRPNAAAFHYHTYSYPQDAVREAFQLSDAVATAEDARFYSLYEDLLGLVAWGKTQNVPNLRLTPVSGLAGGAQTLGGRETLMLSFGGPPPKPGAVNKPGVVLTGGIHAREWIAVEIAYLVAEYLIKHYSTAPQNRYQRTIRDLVNNRRIFIIPMLNPDGNEYTVFSSAPDHRLWRKNRRPLPTTPAAWVTLLTNGLPPGNNNPPPFTNVQVADHPPDASAEYEVPIYQVPLDIPLEDSERYTCTLPVNVTGIDLNRNLRAGGWGYDALGYPPDADPQPSGSASPPSPGYFGPAGGSEAETANLQTLLYQVGPGGIAASIDYHSRGQLILFPSELSYFGGVGPDYNLLGRTLQSLVHGQGVSDYRLGTPRQLMSADATGTVMDYASQLYQSRAFTIELDPQQSVQNGWLLPEDQICGVFEKNIRGALAAIAAPLKPAGTTADPTGILRVQRIYDRIVKVFTTWNVYGRGNRLPA